MSRRRSEVTNASRARALLILTILSFGFIFSCAADEAASRPNVVVILADDLGYGDLACYGHPKVKTPHIDRFAAEGLKLTSCYAAAANCSPARTGLMTGRTPTRVGVYNWIPMFCPMHVRRSEITVATLLRNSGYDTCHSGKWHLNGDFNLPSQPQPWDHGFNHWFSTQNNALPNHRNPNNFVRNGQPAGQLEGYSADLVTDEAAVWLEKKRDKSKPFFLYACYHEPHEPIASAKKYADLYPSDDPSFSAHHGNITQLDAGFGRLLATLDRLDLRKDTFIFFTSDNGPAITSIHPHGSAGPLRDKKGDLYEGGIRVPGLIQWPGHVKSGTVSDEPVSGVDVLPTLCELAGTEPPTDRVLDGASFLPVLSGGKVERDHPLYWQFNRARSDVKVVMRDGDWKILARLDTEPPKPSGGIVENEMHLLKTSELTDFRLYNLKEDIAETSDLAEKNPQEFARLKKELERLYLEVRTEAPIWPAWEWPRYESQRIVWPEYWLKKRRK
jgi:arylsulfatase A